MIYDIRIITLFSIGIIALIIIDTFAHNVKLYLFDSEIWQTWTYRPASRRSRRFGQDETSEVAFELDVGCPCAVQLGSAVPGGSRNFFVVMHLATQTKLQQDRSEMEYKHLAQWGDVLGHCPQQW